VADSIDTKKKIAAYRTGDVSDAVRIQLPAVELIKHGYSFDSVDGVGGYEAPYFPNVDVAFMSRPHLPKLAEHYIETGKLLIVDTDDDFHAVPENHPGYMGVGRGRPEHLAKYEQCLKIAHVVTTTTEELKSRLLKFNKNVIVIPNGWSPDLEWVSFKKKNTNPTILWGGTVTHKQSFELCRFALEQHCRRDHNVKIIIAGDFGIYQSLKIAEHQKMFIPMMPYQEYWYTVGLADIILAPLEDTYFNGAKSPLRLTDTCAKGLPFIASPVGPYAGEEFKPCGYFATSPAEWRDCIGQAIHENNPAMQASRKEVADRYRMEKLVQQWIEVIA